MLLTGLITGTILVAAHILRYYGAIPACLILSLLLTLYFRKPAIRIFWLCLQSIFLTAWIWITADLVMLRLVNHQPWIRLCIIMLLVIGVNTMTLIGILGRRGKSYFGK